MLTLLEKTISILNKESLTEEDTTTIDQYNNAMSSIYRADRARDHDERDIKGYYYLNQQFYIRVFQYSYKQLTMMLKK